MNNRNCGTKYEQMAAEYLTEKGYVILDMNFRVRQGELDIVARYDNTFVFVEVKYRTSYKNGSALEAVNRKKQQQISKTALFYMNYKKINPEYSSIRFDVIGIEGEKDKEEIVHIENAFDFFWEM